MSMSQPIVTVPYVEGTQDYTDVVRSKITSLEALGGGILKFEDNRKYRFTPASSILVPNGVTLKGGHATLISLEHPIPKKNPADQYGNVESYLFEKNGGSGLIAEDLTFHSTISNYCLIAKDVVSPEFRRLKFTGWWYPAIWIQHCSNAQLSDISYETYGGGTLLASAFVHGGSATRLRAVGIFEGVDFNESITNFTVVDSYFKDTREEAIDINGSSKIQILNSTFINCSTEKKNTSIHITGSNNAKVGHTTDVLIQGNTFIESASGAVRVSPGEPTPSFCSNIRIVNNVSRVYTVTPNGAHIKLYGTRVSNVLIENNTLEGGHRGIDFEAGTTTGVGYDFVIRNNTIIEALYEGINVQYLHSPVLEGNNVIRCGVADKLRFGIMLQQPLLGTVTLKSGLLTENANGGFAANDGVKVKAIGVKSIANLTVPYYSSATSTLTLEGCILE
ncbi:right-handed parallel beta-helix repeat-containing protein [Paenibacillus sp. 481]|uniref:right-handed parallel beta-helix repeat-containing protein n=1 Tax=Paenibacillus sp. 481 TaxID=2835869 RepID=UPI001E436E7C|nr:right-handed parallel beta-helix repeat-containing protein [Paenibacillus sp. 481]UHA74957.1 right-handed parallel beta-helix repeat-containing protein [Paenibacillus sp. 481]